MRFHSMMRRMPALLLGTLFVCAPSARADFLLPNHAHTVTVTNSTGGAANDLHVNLVHPSTGGTPSAPPFTSTPPTGGTTIDYDSGSVANNGTATVSWDSKFASDTLDPSDPGNWTRNGNNIGNVTLPNVSYNFTDQGGGLVLVSLVNNSGGALSYNNLSIYNGADVQYFTPSNYLAGATSGTPVSLLVGTSGIFGTGVTDVALFSPTTSQTTYSAGSAELDGLLFGNGSSAIPEPSSVALFVIGAPSLYLLLRRRRARTA